MMASHLGKQLSVVPDRSVATHVRQIAKLDLAGTRVLVEALDHQRDLISSSAASALHEQLDRWQRLSPSEAVPRLSQLARLLVARVDQFDAASRNAAADLALRILHWPAQSRTVSEAELIANCERLLRKAPSRESNQMVDAADSEPPSGATVPASHAVPSARASEEIIDPLADARLPGGGLPIDEMDIPGPVSALAKGANSASSGDEVPRRFTPPERWKPDPLPDSFPREDPDSVDGDLHAWPSKGDEAGPELNQVPSPSNEQLHQRLEQLSDLDLIHRLTGSSRREVTAVERELRRRGFEELELKMARRLADPDPRQRHELCENLSRLPTAPGPWLFWLSYDPDSAVRRLAVTFMATSQDPRLHRRLREMQSSETDAKVRGQLDQLDW